MSSASLRQTVATDAPETVRLRTQLREITEHAARNERVAARFQERELTLLGAETLGALMRELTTGLRSAFGLALVRLVLEDPEARLKHLLDEAAGDDDLDLVLVPALAGSCWEPLLAEPLRPRLSGYDPGLHAPVCPPGAGVASVAVLPLVGAGRLLGLLCLGSGDPARYDRSLGTEFLGRLGVIAAVCLENAVNRERLVRLGLTDALTGLHNRRYLEERMAAEVARCRRHGEPLGVLFADVDHFKRVNDTWGHPAGDAVLQALAGHLRASLRASDIAVRWGGEELAVLLPRTALAEAVLIAERLRQDLRRLEVRVARRKSIRVTVSIGVSCLSPEQLGGENPAGALLADADQALYRAKGAGRDRVEAGG